MRLRVASAGTGKTTSLVARYLQLIGGGVPLRRIAGVTFTRAAAAELQLRLHAGVEDVLNNGEYLGGLYSAPAGTEERFLIARRELPGAVLATIHGFMARTLRLNAPLIGLAPDFQVIGDWDATLLFEEEYHATELLAETVPGHPAAVFMRAVPNPDERLKLVKELFSKRSLAPTLTFAVGPGSAELETFYREVFGRYHARLAGQLLSPSEIEQHALRLLRNEAALKRVVSRFPLVLVDEYQDVNPVQGEFFAALAQAGATLEVVGDPKQSIYGFRNAEVAVFRAAAQTAAKTGDVLPPLRESRRHAPNIAAFLNSLTSHLGTRELGFSLAEAPLVTSVGTPADIPGEVHLHFVHGEGRLAEVRRGEARIVAARIAAWHEHGMPLEDIAVLGRSYTALTTVQDALSEARIPALLLQGRGYYRRSEIRGLYHALQVGVQPGGASLAPFLRSPFAQLALPDFARVFEHEEPIEAVEQFHPDVFATITELTRIVRLPPLEALTALIREPLARGRSIINYLTQRERENVDQLVFEFAQFPPLGMELLLYRLMRLSEQTEAGDVPQSGNGVRLQTIHTSKGLEYRAVVVFDAGGQQVDRPSGVIVDAGGTVHLPGSADFAAQQTEQRLRSQHELYRLLYVAASRPREKLLITASIANEQPRGWATELLRIARNEAAGVHVTHDDQPDMRPLAPAAPAGARTAPEPAPWAATRVAPGRYPPLMSPSRVSFEEEQGEEPLPLLPPGEESLPLSRGSLIGTLFHYAVGQNWNPDATGTSEALRAQELMFAYTAGEQDELVSEIIARMREYQALLGTTLPALSERTTDRSEVPVALHGGDGTVWEGVIDRLYEVNGVWFIDDYKTDRVVKPERYHLQLGIYTKATERLLQQPVTARLVFVRQQRVVELERADLAAALERAGLPPI